MERNFSPNGSPAEILRAELEQRIEAGDPQGYIAMELKLLGDMEDRLPHAMEKMGTDGFKIIEEGCYWAIGMGRYTKEEYEKRITSLARIFNALAETYGIT